MNVQLNIRVDSEVKTQANHVFDSIGMSTSQAINCFLKQVANRQAFPLELMVPNKETIESFNEYKVGQYSKAQSVDDMFKDVGI